MSPTQADRHRAATIQLTRHQDYGGGNRRIANSIRPLYRRCTTPFRLPPAAPDDDSAARGGIGPLARVDDIHRRNRRSPIRRGGERDGGVGAIIEYFERANRRPTMISPWSARGLR